MFKMPFIALAEILSFLYGILCGLVFSVAGEFSQPPFGLVAIGFIVGSLSVFLKEIDNRKIRRRAIKEFLLALHNEKLNGAE